MLKKSFVQQDKANLYAKGWYKNASLQTQRLKIKVVKIWVCYDLLFIVMVGVSCRLLRMRDSLLISSLYVYMAIKHIIVLFVETPRNFITAVIKLRGVSTNKTIIVF